MVVNDHVQVKKSLGVWVAGVSLLLTFSSFVVVFMSWSYASGFFGTLGVPSYYIFSLAKGFEIFPYIGFLTVAVFVVFTIIGMSIGVFIQKKTRWLTDGDSARLFCISILLAGALVFITISQFINCVFIDRNKSLVRFCFEYILNIDLLLFGIILSSRFSIIRKALLFVVILIPFLGLGNLFLTYEGEDIAKSVLKTKGSLALGYEIPSVDVVANSELGWHSFGLDVKTLKGKYFYSALSPFDIRLAFMDAYRYYFLVEQRFEDIFINERDPQKLRGGGFVYQLFITDKSEIDVIRYRHSLPVADEKPCCTNCHPEQKDNNCWILNRFKLSKKE